MIDDNKFRSVFPKGTGSTRRIEVKKLNGYLDEIEAGGITPIKDAEDLKRQILTAKQNVEVKDLITAALDDAGIDYDINELKKVGLDRNALVDIFFSIFEVYPKGQESNSECIGLSPIEEDAGEDTEEGKDSAPTLDRLDDLLDNLEKEYPQNIEEMSVYYLDSKKKSCEDALDNGILKIAYGFPITYQDNFFVEVRKPDFKILKNCVGIVDNETDAVVAYGHAKYYDNKYYLMFDKKNIRFEYFKNNYSFTLIFIPLCCDEDSVYTKSCDIDCRMVPSVDQTLCIDFGTSNTTAGTYNVLNSNARGKDAIETVKFLDVTNNNVEKDMLPTLVYVKDCSSDDIEYLFGYEAKQKIIEEDYDAKATVFYEIKRWINDLDVEVELRDEKGKRKFVPRKDILKAYLKHIIVLSERFFKVKFKRIHFSAPINLKTTFISTMKDFFEDEYIVLNSKVSIDEGIAIIYDHIANLKEEDCDSGVEEEVFVLDCGGGTTDLARCKYSYNTDIKPKKLKITTQFENGDFNFGGNNITYRILQLLKIKLAYHIENKDGFNLDKVIPFDENELLAKIDRAMINKQLSKEIENIYGTLEKAYKEASELIPTCFGDETVCNTENKRRQYKRNYYYLWQMAEAIKIEFYRMSKTVILNFNNAYDRNVIAKNVSQYYLFVKQNGNMTKKDDPMKDIDITNNEIRKLLIPDLYMLLNSLLKDTDYVGKRKYYKLSGQSCRINLFHELLKEFIPGKKLRYRKNEGNNSSSEKVKSSKLKMACINGCIEYRRDAEFSLITSQIDQEKPKLIYDVVHEGNNKEEIILGDNSLFKIIEAAPTSKHLAFTIKDKSGRDHKYFTYESIVSMQNEKEILFQDLKEWVRNTTFVAEDELEQSIFRQISDIGENRYTSVVFVLPDKDKYGINIYQIMIKNGMYYKYGVEKFESYENMVTFFDGER